LTNLVQTLIEEGAEVNVTNDRGQTPLHKAVQTGSMELVQMLIQNSARVNVSDQTGRTPLHMAQDWGDESLIRMLTQNGAVATPRKAIHIESGKMVNANRNALEITYIANEGFLIQRGDRKICIDALVENPWGYMQTGDRVYEKMKKGEPPFNEVDILIGSHNHLDHLTIPMVPDVLRGNPRMKLITSRLGADELQSLPNIDYSMMETQVINITPELGEMVNKNIDDIELQIYGINHAGPGQGAYLTLMTLMTFDDLHVLHVADIAPPSNLEYFKAFQNTGIDIAFIDPFMIADSVGQVIIRQYIQPKQIILMHMRPDEVDRYEKESQAIFNDVIAFREQMEKKCFQR
jgi:L-ascorbate metabolism protein UlaG (beta-lactamase superfamily)